jgi:ribosomal protein S17
MRIRIQLPKMMRIRLIVDENLRNIFGQVGDTVTVGESRPLSKTVRFNTLKVTKGKASKKSFSKF